jgi:hypothetical protein
LSKGDCNVVSSFSFFFEGTAKKHFQAIDTSFGIEFGHASFECFYGSCLSGII